MKQDSATKDYIPSLDGIRAIAFFIVFFSHIYSNKIPGGFGVTIFFFLSGFLITTLLRIEAEKNGTISLKKFYTRRCLRILPPMYLTLALSLFLHLAGVFGTINWEGVVIVASQLTNYYKQTSIQNLPIGTNTYWSLAVEEHFYLIFPALFIFAWNKLRTLRQRAFFFFIICNVVLFWRLILVYKFNVNSIWTHNATDCRLDSILYGSILALVENPYLDKSNYSESTWRRKITPIAFITLFSCFIYRELNFRETFRYSLQGIALAPLFIYSIKYSDHAIYKILNLRFLKFLGRLSYSMYLVHFIFIELFKNIPNHTIQFIAISSSTLLYAYLINIYIEKPLIKFKHKIMPIDQKPMAKAA